MRRALDTDAVISRLLIGMLLSAYVAVIYVVVVAVGTLPFEDPRVDFAPPWWLNLLAFALIAVTFLPVYRWVRLSVRELIYSQHENAYPALAQLSQSLESSQSPQSIMPTIAESIAHTLKLPYVAIATQPSDGAAGAPLTSFGNPPRGAGITRLALTYRGATIGELRVAARRWDEPLTAPELAVLRDLARQVGIALYAAQLTGDLQHARERLVTAREEERRRIRNDLHDGLAPTLASLQLQLGAARSLIRTDPDQAESIVGDLREDLRNATAEIRDLVHALRPPMLDDLGLVGALRNLKLAGSGLHLEVTSPEPMPRLPAAVEVAVFRIASEAIYNVVKHADATECRVTIEAAANGLTLSVADNGRGLAQSNAGGVGMHSMRERAAELGGTLTFQPAASGGICVTAFLPLADSSEDIARDG